MPSAFYFFNTFPDRSVLPDFYRYVVPGLILSQTPQLFGTTPRSLNVWNNLTTGSLSYDREKYPLIQPSVLNDGVTYPDFYSFVYSTPLTVYAQRGLDYRAQQPGSNWQPGITTNYYTDRIRSLLPEHQNLGTMAQPILAEPPILGYSSPSVEARELPSWLAGDIRKPTYD